MIYSRLLQWVSYVGIIVLGVYFYRYEQSYLTYPELPFKVLSPQVRPGEAVRLEVKRCSSASTEKVYSLTHAVYPFDVEDGKDRIMLPGTVVSVQPGCGTNISVVNIVPANTPPGLYYVAGMASTDTKSGFNSREVYWRSGTFEVIK